MKLKLKVLGLAVAVAGVVVVPVQACDLCAIYSAAQARGEMGKGWFASVAHQYTHLGTVTEDNVRLPNDERQRLDGNTTQIAAGYNFAEYFGVQLTVPLIHRSYQRTTDTFGVIENGSVSGLGDLALVANWSPYHHRIKNGVVRWTLLGGVKLPTGSTARLQEEVDELSAAPIVAPNVESAVHGHDLTLGSGSVDAILGTGFFASWNRLYFAAGAQYAWRGWGDYGYRFANDLSWSGGPGVFLVMQEDVMTVSLQANISGEYKPRDTFNGGKLADTAVKYVYAGPQLGVTWKEKLSAEFGVDLPILRDASSLQTVPDYRLRAAITLRF